jgi:hypothetical protein
MSAHLPECTELWSIDDYLHHARPDDPEKCDYCKAFRASEQRGTARAYDRGYGEGVKAARDAVEAALEAGLATSSDKALYFFERSAADDWPDCGYDVTFPKESLLSAIDALK